MGGKRCSLGDHSISAILLKLLFPVAAHPLHRSDAWSIVDPLDPSWQLNATTYPFISHSHVPWEAARAQLISNPAAMLIAADPDIWIISELVPPDFANKLLQVAKARSAFRDPHPRWCFRGKVGDGSTGFKLHAHPDSFHNVSGSQCVFGPEADVIGPAVAGHKATTSRSVLFAAGEESAMDLVGDIVHQQAGLNSSLGFHYQILEYRSDGGYANHWDCGNAFSRDDADEQYKRGGTLLLYLSDVAHGGETCFPRRRLCIRPRQGSAVFFQSLDDERRCDTGSEHASADVQEGSKYVLQRWYYTDYMAPGWVRGRVDPGGEQDYVDCTFVHQRPTCRHYLYNQSRAEAWKLTEKGKKHLKDKDQEAALAAFLAAYATFPTLHMAAGLYGDMLAMRGDDDAARAVLLNALKESPMFPAVHVKLGQLEKKRRHWEAAADHFNKVLRQTGPQFAPARKLAQQELESIAGLIGSADRRGTETGFR
eukprot:TRINITY_DN47355_c0_g1_i1.p1 TRINITY_DN47355_c0_g1~~TRINITY_DN47355_c0_g1_i1.p1  ORF type:complete len:481 (+),score=91.30 TRINITY_DN47355_c0_g1_i1:247-1689(+)